MTHPHAHILHAIIDGKTAQYSNNGDYWSDIRHCKGAEHDLLHGIEGFQFRIKPSAVTINGVELEDDRITECDAKQGYTYFVESLHKTTLFYEDILRIPADVPLIQRGIAHRTKEGAIAFCKARLGIKD